MLEIVTGIVLAAAAGLNAYIPLLGLALLSRFTELVQLPEGWSWLENGWVMAVLAVLLLVEMLVDKIPVLDSVNDALHTVVRPASGGLVFAAGSASETAAVTDPAAFASSPDVWPVVLGICIALVPHALKALARPALNLVTAGAGASVASALEDVGAALLTILAVVVPLLALIAAGVGLWLLLRRTRAVFTARRARGAAAAAPRESN